MHPHPCCLSSKGINLASHACWFGQQKFLEAEYRLMNLPTTFSWSSLLVISGLDSFDLYVNKPIMITLPNSGTDNFFLVFSITWRMTNRWRKCTTTLGSCWWWVIGYKEGEVMTWRLCTLWCLTASLHQRQGKYHVTLARTGITNFLWSMSSSLPQWVVLYNWAGYLFFF